MSALQPLTDEEREMAEQYLYLVDQFLYRHRLDPDEYYDIAIFGYLEAIQRERRMNCPEEKKNFPGLTEVCIRNAVYQEWRRQYADMRKADWLSISLDGAPAYADDDDGISLYEVVADPRASTEESVVKSDLIRRILAEATPREHEAIDYACAGFEAHEIAELMGISVYTASRFLYNFRVKAHAVEEDREAIRAPQWARDKEKCQERNRKYQRKYWETHREEYNARTRAKRAENPEKFREKDRRYREAHREEINARDRARRAAKKERTRQEKEERLHTQPAVQSV